MDKQRLGYWLATGIFGAAMLGGGTANLLHFEAQREIITALGYPEYLMTILGLAKLSGAITLLLPGLPLLKEWAYAGFAFDLLGATASHIIMGDAVAETAPPFVMLGIAAVSYALRPADRRVSRT